MKLVYKDDPTREVKVGDTVAVDAGSGDPATVHYFRQPHKPDSEGSVTVMLDGVLREFYASVIGAEWIEREDRSQPLTLNPAAAWPYPSRTPSAEDNDDFGQVLLAGAPPMPGSSCTTCQLPPGNSEPLPMYGHDLGNLKPGLYLGLFHGRDTTEQDMNDDWGFDGPVIGPLKYVHTTYASELKLEFEEHEDWRRYFPEDNVVQGFTHGDSAPIGRQGTGDFAGEFDDMVGGWPKLNDPAVRQQLLDSGLVKSFEFQTEAQIPIKESLVEYGGKFYGDWTVFVHGIVMPTAAQMAAELTDRPDLRRRLDVVEREVTAILQEAQS